MNSREDNIRIFLENRDLAYKEYNVKTSLMLQSVKFYENAKDSVECSGSKNQKIEFVKEDTARCGYLRRVEFPKERVAILNFADALEPGGLVKYGEFTQEEAICRSSNLYESLLLGEDFYYNYNKGLHSSLYSHRLIYSKDVLIFRNDITGEIYDNPKLVDVITCPAPSIRLYDLDFFNLVHDRIECIIKSAYDNNVNTIVLGAWGCGAFGQDPNMIGICFAEVLKKYQVFDYVVFAFKSLNGDKNMESFKEKFSSVYYK